jgi:putative methionine-R-sulfoxide reductase with GAF domain
MPDLTTAGGQTFPVGLPGQVTDTSDIVVDSGINDRQIFMAIGSADATAGALYGAGTLTTKVLSLGVNGAAISGLTLAAGSNVASLAAFIAAIKAKTEWAGINAQIGGPNGNQLVLSAVNGLVVDVNGTSTANAVLGLTAGTRTAWAVNAVDFGVAVVRSNFDGRISQPLLDSDVIVGISVRNPFARAASSTGQIDYAQSFAVPFMRFGNVYAVAAEDGVAGDAVISLTQGNTFTGGLWGGSVVPGALGTSTAGAAGVGRVAVTGATWDTTPVKGVLGKVRIVR